ncbi:MAG: fatty acid desaturase [Legionellaceae bacterium]|nr:fatty acid desaturase [Legionellaceae bacterium]
MNDSGQKKQIKIDKIRQELTKIDKIMRKNHPWLKYQSTIAVLIALSSAIGFVCSSSLYFYGYIPAWLCIIINAFLCSFIHELEHDTFHLLYFKKQPVIRNIFLAFLWLFKPNTINPWVRRKIHLHHHKSSGTPDDQEERLIGNGLPYTAKRFFIMLDPFFALLQFKHLQKDSKTFQPYLLISALFPMCILFASILLAWISFYFVIVANHLFNLDWQTLSIVNKHIDLLNFLMVIYISPAILRVFCLQFISSSIHYYGGVDQITKQTQVITKWYLKPMQWLCCSFGETHAIHHIWVAQPFYLRHMTHKASHAVMYQNGIRFNDMGTFKRHNHYDKKNNR